VERNKAPNCPHSPFTFFPSLRHKLAMEERDDTPNHTDTTNAPRHLWCNESRGTGLGLPFYKIDRLIGCIPAKVDAWAESRLMTSTSEAPR
jgi:hypothetical protein